MKKNIKIGIVGGFKTESNNNLRDQLLELKSFEITSLPKIQDDFLFNKQRETRQQRRKKERDLKKRFVY